MLILNPNLINCLINRGTQRRTLPTQEQKLKTFFLISFRDLTINVNFKSLTSQTVAANMYTSDLVEYSPSITASYGSQRSGITCIKNKIKIKIL